MTGNITDNAVLVFHNSTVQPYGSVISGSGTVTMAGTATLVLSSANTYTGDTTISAGTLALGARTSFPTARVTAMWP